MPQLEKSLHSNEEKINKIIMKKKKKKKSWSQNLESRIRRDEASLSTEALVLNCLSERAHRSVGGLGKEARQLIPKLHQQSILCTIEKASVVSVKTRGGAGDGKTGGGGTSGDFGGKPPPTPSASLSTCSDFKAHH